MNVTEQKEVTAKKEKTCTLHLHENELPQHGKSRWRQIKPFIPCSREKFRQLELEGKAPKRERLGIRCTFYDNAEVHKWLADPVNYRAPDAQQKGV